MLSELKQLHGELKDEIAALRAEVSQAAPDENRVAAARLRLSRVSRRRRSLLECGAYPSLHAVGPEAAGMILDLRRDAARQAVASSAHITRWTMRAIVEDWPGYQAASTEMTAGMMKRIAQEEAILYPLLAHLEKGAAAR